MNILEILSLIVINNIVYYNYNKCIRGKNMNRNVRENKVLNVSLNLITNKNISLYIKKFYKYIIKGVKGVILCLVVKGMKIVI